MTQKKSDADRHADILDVHLLDILGQVEALFRSAREIQRGILQVRGVPRSATAAERQNAANAVRQRLALMLNECESATDAIREASRAAEDLKAVE